MVGFVLVVEKIFVKLNEWRELFGFVFEVLNLGGGFGICYIEEDEFFYFVVYVEKIIEVVKENVELYVFDILEIWIELGCLFVGDVGMMFYIIGL